MIVKENNKFNKLFFSDFDSGEILYLLTVDLDEYSAIYVCLKRVPFIDFIDKLIFTFCPNFALFKNKK